MIIVVFYSILLLLLTAKENMKKVYVCTLVTKIISLQLFIFSSSRCCDSYFLHSQINLSD